MEGNKYLFEKILFELDKAGVLDKIMLIGSWVLPVYRKYFEDAPEIPLLRTTDLDFLIPNPPRIRKEYDISQVLQNLDFEIESSVIGEFSKFVHPDLEVEFIIPELGRGRTKAVWINNLKVSVQPLRYMNLFFQFKLIIMVLQYTYRNRQRSYS